MTIQSIGSTLHANLSISYSKALIAPYQGFLSIESLSLCSMLNNETPQPNTQNGCGVLREPGCIHYCMLAMPVQVSDVAGTVVLWLTPPNLQVREIVSLVAEPLMAVALVKVPSK